MWPEFMSTIFKILGLRFEYVPVIQLTNELLLILITVRHWHSSPEPNGFYALKENLRVELVVLKL